MKGDLEPQFPVKKHFHFPQDFKPRCWSNMTKVGESKYNKIRIFSRVIFQLKKRQSHYLVGAPYKNCSENFRKISRKTSTAEFFSVSVHNN